MYKHQLLESRSVVPKQTASLNSQFFQAALSKEVLQAKMSIYFLFPYFVLVPKSFIIHFTISHLFASLNWRNKFIYVKCFCNCCIYMSCRIIGSDSLGFEDICLLGYEAMYSVEFQPTFRRRMQTHSSGLKSKKSKKPALLFACLMLVYYSAYSQTLKMEATYSSETSFNN
jgi:hypothetical protein